ncbi:MAG: hypothetical protein Q9214_000276, partial [Letrouitia sp. 1 TL-2023]
MATAHSCKHGLQPFYRRRSINLPDFLVPAFYGPESSASRPFSTSTPRASRVGATPVPVPPGVIIRLLEPSKRRGRITRFEPPKLLEIEGPL